MSFAVLLLAGCGKVLEVPLDATPDDAPPLDSADGPTLPTMPPLAIGQAADLAIGSPDISTRTGGTTADTSRSAGGLCATGDHMWISDLTNARVLQLNAPVLVFSAAADLAVGQPSLTTSTTGPTNQLLTKPPGGSFDTLGDVACNGTVVAVSDSASNRIVILDALPAANGPTFNTVLGQTTFTGAAAVTSSTGLSNPHGIWTDGTRLVVADTGNHRVLIWSTFPTANATPADVVLGQANFNVAAAPTPPTPSSMNQPLDVFFDGERLYVSDSQNNRVMGWNGMPTQNNQPADFFVGQAGGSTGSPNAAAGSQTPNAIGFHIPGEITVAHGSLFVVDQVNFRVVVHTPRPTTSGTSAGAVLGKSDFADGAVAAEQELTPRGVAVQGDKLWVSDSNLALGSSRVVRYQLTNLP